MAFPKKKKRRRSGIRSLIASAIQNKKGYITLKEKCQNLQLSQNEPDNTRLKNIIIYIYFFRC